MSQSTSKKPWDHRDSEAFSAFLPKYRGGWIDKAGDIVYNKINYKEKGLIIMFAAGFTTNSFQIKLNTDRRYDDQITGKKKLRDCLCRQD